jgi:hypothetical protein
VEGVVAAVENVATLSPFGSCGRLLRSLLLNCHVIGNNLLMHKHFMSIHAHANHVSHECVFNARSGRGEDCVKQVFLYCRWWLDSTGAGTHLHNQGACWW